MNTIIENLTDPSWWFTGIFFALVAYLFPKILHSTTIVILHLNGLKKILKLMRLRKVKDIRFDDTKVIIEGVKASNWQVIFVLTMLLFAYNYFTTRIFISSGDKLSGLLFILYAAPVYIVEILYILQNNFYKTIIFYRDKLHKKVL